VSTNFYIANLQIQGTYTPVHIGKSSMGWCFSLRIYPAVGISSLVDWLPYLLDPIAEIRDEYGGKITPNYMFDIITQREIVLGPKKLQRHTLEHGCCGHGEGTWDYFDQEFS
jgi:hypothetical protein